MYQSPRLSERLDDRGEDHEIDLGRCSMRASTIISARLAGNGDDKADPSRVLHLVWATDISDDIPDWAWE